jgi:hypothetical protein
MAAVPLWVGGDTGRSHRVCWCSNRADVPTEATDQAVPDRAPRCRSRCGRACGLRWERCYQSDHDPPDPWAVVAGQQGDFVGGCLSGPVNGSAGSGGSDAYCVCALRSVMATDPDPSALGGGVAGLSAEAFAGTVAAESGERHLFPACKGK